MLKLLDMALEKFLGDTVPTLRDWEFVYEAPERNWSQSVEGSAPTVNLFLWDVRRNKSERDAGLETHLDEAGRVIRSEPLPRVDCRYLLTARAADKKQEHEMLGLMLQALLSSPQIPDVCLDADYARVLPHPTLRVADPDERESTEFWSAIGGQLKPGLDVVVTATVPAVVNWMAGPPVKRYALDVLGTGDGGNRGGRDHLAWVGHRDPDAEPGSIKVGPTASAVVGDDHTYVLPDIGQE
jgi:hypothetical protein